MFAVDEGHKDIVQRLVSAGADVHIRDKVCGDLESVCQMLDVVPNGLGKIICTVYMYVSLGLVYTCAQMIYCVRFHGPDHFSRIAHVHEERGKGREGKHIICATTGF